MHHFLGCFKTQLQNLLSCRQAPKSFCFKGFNPKLLLKQNALHNQMPRMRNTGTKDRKKKGGAEQNKKEREVSGAGGREHTKRKRSRGEVAVSVQIWHPIASLCTLQEQRAVQLIVSWFLISIHRSARQSRGHVWPVFRSGEDLAIYTTIKTQHGKQDYLCSLLLAAARTDSICVRRWFPQAMFTGNVAVLFKRGCLN